jgi:hypothetical protein
MLIIKNRVIIGIIVLSIICSCGGIADVRESLGGGYFYDANGITNRKIIYCSTKDVGEAVITPIVKKHRHNNDFILVAQEFNRSEMLKIKALQIEATVNAFKNYLNQTIDMSSKESQIINKHKSDSAFYTSLGKRISFKNTIEDQNLLEKVADSIMTIDSGYSSLNDGKISYWIIDKKTRSVFGPYNKEGFDGKRQTLNISFDLQ